MNEWCFRSRFCTVRLNWAGDNLGYCSTCLPSLQLQIYMVKIICNCAKLKMDENVEPNVICSTDFHNSLLNRLLWRKLKTDIYGLFRFLVIVFSLIVLLNKLTHATSLKQFPEKWYWRSISVSCYFCGITEHTITIDDNKGTCNQACKFCAAIWRICCRNLFKTFKFSRVFHPGKWLIKRFCLSVEFGTIIQIF